MKHLALAVMLSLAAIATAQAADPEANKKVVLDFYEKGLNQKDFVHIAVGVAGRNLAALWNSAMAAAHFRRRFSTRVRRSSK